MKKVKEVVVLLAIVIYFSGVSVAQTVDHQADVEFQSNSGTVPPVDPETGKEIVPGPSPTNGPLSLSYVTDLRFGKHQLSRSAQSFYAQNEWIKDVNDGLEKEYSAFVQINDLRGNAAGWTLLVSQNNLFHNEVGTPIESSSFVISAVDITSPDNMKNPPTTLDQKKTVTSEGELVQIAKANENEGMGTWHVHLGSKQDVTQNIKLTVPQAGIKEKGKYTTSLKWVLQDAL
ncbi:WxL domain-containing protein [Vagococcus sp. BWB3-3]|uniref:WxL domain-containing protein n=1 Tax=Vagococcus allomyrinae TaxID=2794353 RepID=A0A940P2E7_9ENTE|nr:WxL domain-containing protein [Vagococcus allomyrinae]MBP1040222.1 WxL domain-containing protein [Vagococcus allomyrinae]